jgi:hypothetical protein
VGGVASTRVDRRPNEHELQRQLRDLICLAVVGDHVRWVLTDDDELGGLLAEAAGEWRALAERVATQLVADGVPPDGRVRSLAKDISVNWVPEGWLSAEAARTLIAGRLALVAEWARYRHSQAKGAAAELLDGVAAALEAQLGAVQAQAARAASSPTIAP